MDWDLIAYTDLTLYSSRYEILRELYDATANICQKLSEDFKKTEVPLLCRQFVQATIPYLYEIENNHNNILESIGEISDTNVRPRRGIEKAVSRMANVLYGSFANLDVEFIVKKIVELTKNKQNEINLTDNKTRLIKASVNEINGTLYHLAGNQDKLERNINYLHNLILLNAESLDQVIIKTKLLEQAVLFEIILNQYAYETQNLMNLINSITNGNVYTNIFSPGKLIKELKELK